MNDTLTEKNNHPISSVEQYHYFRKNVCCELDIKELYE